MELNKPISFPVFPCFVAPQIGSVFEIFFRYKVYEVSLVLPKKLTKKVNSRLTGHFYVLSYIFKTALFNNIVGADSYDVTTPQFLAVFRSVYDWGECVYFEKYIC